MKSRLQALLSQALASLSSELGRTVDWPPATQIDATRDARHGDLSSNLALVIAKPLGKPSRAVAEMLVRHLPTSELIAKVEIAGPGFINFFLAPAAFQAVVSEVLKAGAAYGCEASRSRGKILVEFVSANPTGPMHVGHGRGAAYGDSLSNILAATGWDVHREYYINDSGRQVDILTVSVWIRYLELCGKIFPFPSRGYPAEYVRKTAEKLRVEFGDRFAKHAEDAFIFRNDIDDPSGPSDASDEDREVIKVRQDQYLDELIASVQQHPFEMKRGYEVIRDFAVDDQLASIRATLDTFGVHFDLWYSERALVDSGFAKTVIDRLCAAGHIFKDEGATWLRTMTFGDEKNRVLFKADRSATYFANDLAYHVDKLDRGYSTLLDVWGADHHGYIGRVRAAIEALTGRKDALRVQLMQFVTLSSGRMGKRSGNFVTLHDLISEAGTDATRFFYLLRSHDQHLEFDIELARSQSNDNPVFYVQYAHARIASVFRQLAERGQSFDPTVADAALHRLVEPQEKHLLTVLQRYPEVLASAAGQYSPHMLAFYLREVADGLHSYYNAHKFLLTTPRSENLLRGDPGAEDAELQTARLALIAATRQILANALSLLGVSAPDSM